MTLMQLHEITMTADDDTYSDALDLGLSVDVVKDIHALASGAERQYSVDELCAMFN